MQGEAVQKIGDLAVKAAAQVVTIEGTEYSTVALHNPRKARPQADSLGFSALKGLVDYINSGLDGVSPETHLVHVAAPGLVTLVDKADDDFRVRETLAVAIAGDLTEGWVGGWWDQEMFVIGLMTRFVDNADRADLLKLAGNIEEGELRTSADDGVSQKVTAKSGVAVVESVMVKNPWELAPYRTFREVEQGKSAFIIRIQKGRAGPQLALFESDGGAWKLDAMASVGAYLSVQLPDYTVLR